MKNLGILMSVFDYLNENNSSVFIEHFEANTGEMRFSNQKELNNNSILTISVVDDYIKKSSETEANR